MTEVAATTTAAEEEEVLEDSNKAVTRPSGSPSWSASQDVCEARRKTGTGFNYRAAERATIQGYAQTPSKAYLLAFILLFTFLSLLCRASCRESSERASERTNAERKKERARRLRHSRRGARHDGATSKLRRQDDVRPQTRLGLRRPRGRSRSSSRRGPRSWPARGASPRRSRPCARRR